MVRVVPVGHPESGPCVEAAGGIRGVTGSEQHRSDQRYGEPVAHRVGAARLVLEQVWTVREIRSGRRHSEAVTSGVAPSATADR
jgi:hypothetical protein